MSAPCTPLPGQQAGYVIDTLIDSATLQARIKELGQQISQDFRGEKLIVVGVLKGAFLFMADLVRQLDLPVECEFLGVSSYGDDTESSGEVKVTADLTRPIHDQNVLVVEDIIDTGLTLAYIVRSLEARKPRTLRICSLLDKRERRQTALEGHYIGFTIPNAFVVGYGLDFTGLLRNVPAIGVMRLGPDGKPQRIT